MASHLEIKRIPVIVKRVHADWVADWQERTSGTVKEAVRAGLEELSARIAPGS